MCIPRLLLSILRQILTILLEVYGSAQYVGYRSNQIVISNTNLTNNKHPDLYPLTLAYVRLSKFWMLEKLLKGSI